MICYSTENIGTAVGQPENAAGKNRKNELRNVCLFVAGKEKKERETMSSSQEKVVYFIYSECTFFLFECVCICAHVRVEFVCEYPSRKRADLRCILQCDWWSAVPADGLMEAALLWLVEGLIHHSPVRVHSKHLRSSQLNAHTFFLSFLSHV